MLRKTFLIMFVVAASLLVAVVALASAPAAGVVVEGHSVPGVALGETRAQVETAYGQLSCNDMSYYDGRTGLDGLCRVEVDGGGHLTLVFFTADGEPAQAAATDVLSSIRWSQAVSGWVTTAGVNTTLALEDPEAVAAAYPNAVVTYNSVFNHIASIEDKALGIFVDYDFFYLSGTKAVSMLIRLPSEPDPLPPKETHVTSIDLRVSKMKGDRQVRGYVNIRDENGDSAAGANVLATWIFPDGSTQTVSDLTARSGGAYFQILDAPRGTLSLRIDNVILDGYRFDSANSVLSASTLVK